MFLDLQNDDDNPFLALILRQFENTKERFVLWEPVSTGSLASIQFSCCFMKGRMGMVPAVPKSSPNTFEQNLEGLVVVFDREHLKGTQFQGFLD